MHDPTRPRPLGLALALALISTGPATRTDAQSTSRPAAAPRSPGVFVPSSVPREAARPVLVVPDPPAPHNLILAVDVSPSMWTRYDDPKRPGEKLPPNDERGIRWDGIQFAIDVARPGDRIALVLFSGNAQVASRAIDPTGFVDVERPYATSPGQAKSGRDALKDLVKELQAIERAHGLLPAGVAQPPGRQYPEDYQLRSINLPLRLRTGTSVVLTLATMNWLKLLDAATADPEGRKAETWVFLMTDGSETRPPSNPVDFTVPFGYSFVQTPQKPYDFYGYMGWIGSEGRRGDDLDHFLRTWEVPPRKPTSTGQGEGVIKPFRDREIPIFTFGVGSSCDFELLRRISDLSGPDPLTAAVDPKRPPRTAAAYRPKQNSRQLFGDLQQVEWELRQNWYKEALQSQGGRFLIPPLGLWQEMGILLYLEPPGNGGQDRDDPNEAPAEAKVETLATESGRALGDLRIYKSRSHWYYALDSARGNVPLDEKLVLQVEPTDGQATRCIVAMRDGKQQFTYVEPRGTGVEYSPKGTIPLRVDFDPSGGLPADRYKLRAVLTPGPRAQAGKAEDAPRPPVAVDLLFRGDRPDGKGAFVGEAILEPALDAADPRSVGPWSVDVEIEILGDESDPLSGARRRLIRHEIQVGPFPEVVAPLAIELTNAPGSSGDLPVSLNPRGAGPGPVASISAAIKSPPIAAPTAPAIDWSGLAVGPSTLEVGRPDRGDRFRVTLPGEVWNGLPVNLAYERGVVRLHAPWDGPGSEKGVWVSVRKVPYRIKETSTPAVAFEVDADGPFRDAQPIRAALDTAIAAADEPVYLSAKPTFDRSNLPKPPDELVLRKVGPSGGPSADQKVKLALASGSPIRLRGQLSAESDARLMLSSATGLPPGEYRNETKLYLVGPAVEPKEIRVGLAADRVDVYIGDSKLDARRPYRMVGLAGTNARRDLVLRSSLGRPIAEIKGAKEAKRIGRVGGGDGLDLDRNSFVAKPPAGAEGRATFNVPIPTSIREGAYAGQIQLAVAAGSARGLYPAKLVPFQVQVNVLHHGVRPDRPLIVVEPKAPCDDSTAPSPFALHSDAEADTPVRWSLDKLVSGPIRPDQVVVRSKDGREISGQKGADVTEPISKDAKAELSVEVRGIRNVPPGAYRVQLKFNAVDPSDPEGAQADVPSVVDVWVVVPGRVATVPDPGPVAVDPKQPGRLIVPVRVACYGERCPPDSGTLYATSADGKVRPGSALPVGDPAKPGAATPLPGLPKELERRAVSYDYRASLSTQLAGVHRFEVRWPSLCPATSESAPDGSGVLAATGGSTLIVRSFLTSELPGPIAVEPVDGTASGPETVLFAGEPALIKVELEPKLAASRKQVNLTIPGLDDPTLTLLDDGKDGDARAGDFIYTARIGEGRFKEKDVGKSFEVVAPNDLPLLPAKVNVGMALADNPHVGVVVYGGGKLMAFFGAQDRAANAQALLLTNKRGEDCSVAATILYPRLAESRTSIAPGEDLRRVEVASGPGKASDVVLKVDADTSRLSNDRTATLAIQAELTESAHDAARGQGDEPHPNLGKTSFAIVQVEMNWDDGRSRTILLPVSVDTQNYLLFLGPYAGFVAGAIALLIVGIILWIRRQQPGQDKGKAEPRQRGLGGLLDDGPSGPSKPGPRPKPADPAGDPGPAAKPDRTPAAKPSKPPRPKPDRGRKPGGGLPEPF